jgi:hypothetical protein
MCDVNGNNEPVYAVQEAGPEEIAGKESPERVEYDVEGIGAPAFIE